MLSLLAASAAEFLHLLIFIFDLDLFVEIINRNRTLKITTIASASPYHLSIRRKIEIFNFKKKSINPTKIID